MKRSFKTMAVVMAIVMSLVVAQAACAVEIIGTVESVNHNNSIVVVEGGVETTVYGIPFNCLYNKYEITLTIGSVVYIEAESFTCSDGTIKWIATKVCVDDACCDVNHTQKKGK